MFLNENQQEMYNDCTFLNERFNPKEKYGINDFNKEKIIESVKNAIDSLIKKNSKIKGVTFDQAMDSKFLKKNKVYIPLKSGYNVINWITEVRRYSRSLKFNYAGFSECYLCRKQRETLLLFPHDWQYAILIFYIEPYETPRKVSSGKGEYKTYDYALKIRKIKLDKSYLKSENLSESVDLKNILKLSGEKFTKAMNYCAKFAKNAVTKDKFRKAKWTSNLAEIKELLEPDCVQAFILAGDTACKRILLPFVAEYFDNKAVTAKEKEGKAKQFKNDLKEAERIADEEFDTSLKKINEQGIKCFKENINECIKPYKL